MNAMFKCFWDVVYLVLGTRYQQSKALLPPNGHRKLVGNHKDDLRDDAVGNLVPIRSAAQWSLT